MKILIIDDNRKITDSLNSYLRLKGHDVIVANNGRNGLELIENCDFCATILELNMHDFNGFDVMKKLHEDGKVNGNKIIVLTSNNLSETEIQTLLKQGVTAVLKKPANLQVLLKTLAGK